MQIPERSFQPKYLLCASQISVRMQHVIAAKYKFMGLNLLLHDAIFLATCLAMALRDKLQDDCSV